MKTKTEKENFWNLYKKITNSIISCNYYNFEEGLKNFSNMLKYLEKNKKEFLKRENLIIILEKIKQQKLYTTKDIFEYTTTKNKQEIVKEFNLKKQNYFELKKFVFDLLNYWLFLFEKKIKTIIRVFKIELKKSKITKEIKNISLKLVKLILMKNKL